MLQHQQFRIDHKRRLTMRTHLFGSKTRYTTASCLALALALIASLAMDVDAKWTRNHASACTTYKGTLVDTGFAFFNDSTTQVMALLCAVSDTDRFLKQNVTQLNVHGLDGHSSMNAGAMVCRSFFHTTGGSCGPAHQSSGVQDYTLQPSLSQWTSSTTADFGYLYVTIPPRQGTSNRSSFRGYYTQGN
jgi:hypothetical protein